MREIDLKIFGAFRNLTSESTLRLELADTVQTVTDLKQYLAALWMNQDADFAVPALLQKSAVAAGDEILDETAQLPVRGEMAILPPVSGG